MAFINNDGIVQISNDVLISIIEAATMEVEGVHSINSTLVGEIIGKLGKKNNSKGINIVNKNDNLTINISLSVKINYKLVEVAQNVQNKVKLAIENMTGLEIDKININILSVDIGKEKSAYKQD